MRLHALLLAGAVLVAGCARKESAPVLLDELGCAGCHPGPAADTVAAGRAPSLENAGRRFRSAYLLEYLQRPGVVRRGIGRTRMPDFGLNAAEALALTLFLEGQQSNDGARPWPAGIAEAPSPPRDSAGVQRLLTERYRCTACHTLDGRGQGTASELRSAGFRVAENWIRPFLLDPDHAFLGSETMPSFFFQFDQASGAYQALVPEALGDVQAIADALVADNDGRRAAADRAYADARARHPNITVEDGERLFRAQNCAACHRTRTGERAPRTAPDLRIEGARVSRAWLESYLAHPRPLRPSGSPPGSGARMPDFRLSESDAKALADQIAGIDGAVTLPARAADAPLSRFSMMKTHRLIQEKLACLGCHRLAGEGGTIGPDLSSLAGRLQPAFVQRMIEDPHGVAPESVMPQPDFLAPQAKLVVAFLLQQTLPADSPRYVEVGRPIDDREGARGEKLYKRYCSPCHGREGRGDGFNAKQLPKQPRNFTDASYMSSRPDDTLFDAISAGGSIVGLSHRMPAWGRTLSEDDIAALVQHLRKLCQCEGPGWSRDGAASSRKQAEGANP